MLQCTLNIKRREAGVANQAHAILDGLYEEKEFENYSSK